MGRNLDRLFRDRISPRHHLIPFGSPAAPWVNGTRWLGQRVRVYWEDDLVWYAGVIVDYSARRVAYQVLYDDDGLE
ncbi:hypothetical protein T484DRAFT_1832877, partial [Baffinella frigidus]